LPGSAFTESLKNQAIALKDLAHAAYRVDKAALGHQADFAQAPQALLRTTRCSDRLDCRNLPATQDLADLGGLVASHLDRKGRAVALANLQAAFGEERDLSDRKVIARRLLQLFGRSFLELFWSARLNASKLDRFLLF
jgi:hypothetical protein